jgi:hypothetical protein
MDDRTWFACLLLGACTVAPPANVKVTVRVESDPGIALADASVIGSGKALGKTDARGLSRVTLTGPLGARIPLQVRCPDGFRQPLDVISVILRAAEPDAPPPEYAVACPPALRSLVVSVRAQNGAGLPLKRLGKEIARTDEQGAAHALLKVAPGEDLTLSLDTSEHDALRPKNPTFKLTMPDHDEVTLFDQPFSIERPPAPRRVVVKPDIPERF